jgi:hypothetical protein
VILIFIILKTEHKCITFKKYIFKKKEARKPSKYKIKEKG